MKEVTLPWTCNQRDKMIKGFQWIALIGFPIMFCYGIYSSYINSEVALLLAFFGYLGSTMSWIMAYITRTIEFPTFKCKQQNPNEVSS